MQDRIYLKEIFADSEKYGGKKVVVAGWVKTLRDSKAFGFIELNDGSCFKNVQVVFEREKIENYDEIARQNVRRVPYRYGYARSDSRGETTV